MKPVLAFPVYDRPHYVALALDSWRNVRGIDAAHVVYRCEPGQPVVENLVRCDRPPCSGEVTVNDQRLGNDQNMKAALEQAFGTGAEFVVAAEDDVLVSADLLEYMSAMADYYAGNPEVLAVTAWQDNPPGPLDEVRRVEWFWGGACWGMWRDRWEQVKDGWPPSGQGYDGYLWRICETQHKVTIQPMATRCKNIGVFGTNTGGSDGFQAVWDRQQFTPAIPAQKGYRELPGVWNPFGGLVR